MSFLLEGLGDLERSNKPVSGKKVYSGGSPTEAAGGAAEPAESAGHGAL